MSWSAVRLADLPLVLCGPLLRRTERQAVTVWVALKEPRKVTLRVYAAGADTLLLQGTRSTVKVGENLHVVAVTARTGTALAWGTMYRYNLHFGAHGGDGTPVPTTGQKLLDDKVVAATAAAAREALLYTDVSGAPNLPSFVLPPEDPNALRLLHASCRKPHGGGLDGLAILDKLVRAQLLTPAARPQQLFLTGDQIYADDVADTLLAVCTRLGDLLLGRASPERLPRVLKTGADLTPGRRQKVVIDDAGFSTEAGKSHLMTFAEFVAMYVLCWSPAAWPATLPELADVDPELAKRADLERDLKWLALSEPGRMPPPSAALKQAAAFDAERDSIAGFRETLPDVRRALANVPSYMIFDDHEVTDDWYITLEWCRGAVGPAAAGKPATLGRRILRNGLLAYVLFQSWGNTPERFEGQGDESAAGRALLAAVHAWNGAEGAETVEFERRLGLPTGYTSRTDPPRAIPDRPEGALDYHYHVTWARHQAIVLDTRTWREFPVGAREPPSLLWADTVLARQIDAAPYLGREGVTLVVSPAPIVGWPLIEDLVQKYTSKIYWGLKRWDSEAWGLQPATFERLLSRLFSRAVVGDDGVRRQRLVALSGDVHYGFVAALHYDARSPYGLAGQPAAGVLAQLTSSALKNEEGKTWFAHVNGFEIGRVGMPRIRKVGFANPSGGRFRAGTFPNRWIPEIRMDWYLGGTPAVAPLEEGWETANWPDWSYDVEFIRHREADPEAAPRGSTPVPVDYPPPGDRAAAIRAYLGAAQNLDGYRGEWGNGKEIVGYANLGEVTFRWEEGDRKYVTQTLWWRLPGMRDAAPLTKGVVDLSVNQARARRYGGFELRDGDRDAKANAAAIYGGVRQPASAPAADHVRRLKRDLRELGFALAGPDDGEFTRRVRWAVREFQSYAKMNRAAEQPWETRLSAAVAATATSLPVQSEANLPTSGSYRLRVGGELMRVTGGQGTKTLAVERAIDGTVALDHAASTPVTVLRGRYSEVLRPVDNPSTLRYKGPVSGVANATTQDLITYWIEHGWRCPVVVEAYAVVNDALVADVFRIPGPPSRPAENLWTHDELPLATPLRVFARDVSGYFDIPPRKREGHPDHADPATWDHPAHPELLVLGRATEVAPWSGPVAFPESRHTWRPEGEMLPEAMLPGAPTLQGLVQNAGTDAVGRQLSTFKVVRAVAEVEAIGYFDCVNSWDSAFVSLGPCHWTAGPAKGSGAIGERTVSPGELWGYLAYLRTTDAAAFHKVVGFFGLAPGKAWGRNGQPLFQTSARKYETHPEIDQHDALPALMERKAKEFDLFRLWHWFHRFVMAGRTVPGYRRRMWHMARIRLRDILEAPWDRPGQPASVAAVPNDDPQGASPPATRPARIRDVVTSERGVALIYRWHILSPGGIVASGAAGSSLRAALTRARAAAPAAFGGAPNTWGQAAEDALLQAIRDQADVDHPQVVNPKTGALEDSSMVQTLRMVWRWPSYGSNPRGYTLPIAVLPAQTAPPPPDPQSARLYTGRNSFRADFTDLPLPRL